ncbi:uncharacterized protein LOC105262408 [Musca domestica]|uniref:Uncharacterized protein LOC105262408 n=1 Tax=Musca domestica TaxID=7370 RepID=A0A1I8NJN0_MUSDO|nr:uncharacterized protein LOC105262408 [Musca domestica]
MEFANQQKLIKKLEDHCQELKGDIEQVLSERRSYLEKQKQLIQRLDQVQNSIDDAVVEESSLSNRVESVKKGGTESGEDFLQKVCLTLGFQISKRVVEANNISRKLLYDNNCSVSFNEINQLYDLVETFPPHPEFVAIRQFLKNSQDLEFLLTTLKGYFDSSSTVKRNK